MKVKNKDMMKSIKEYEKAQREATKTDSQTSIETVDFDQWWMERSPHIKQPAHVKEILKADAKARGIEGKQAHAQWDWAAKQFGLTFQHD